MSSMQVEKKNKKRQIKATVTNKSNKKNKGSVIPDKYASESIRKTMEYNISTGTFTFDVTNRPPTFIKNQGNHVTAFGLLKRGVSRHIKNIHTNLQPKLSIIKIRTLRDDILLDGYMQKVLELYPAAKAEFETTIPILQQEYNETRTRKSLMNAQSAGFNELTKFIGQLQLSISKLNNKNEECKNELQPIRIGLTKTCELLRNYAVEIEQKIYNHNCILMCQEICNMHRSFLTYYNAIKGITFNSIKGFKASDAEGIKVRSAMKFLDAFEEKGENPHVLEKKKIFDDSKIFLQHFRKKVYTEVKEQYNFTAFVTLISNNTQKFQNMESSHSIATADLFGKLYTDEKSQRKKKIKKWVGLISLTQKILETFNTECNDKQGKFKKSADIDDVTLGNIKQIIISFVETDTPSIAKIFAEKINIMTYSDLCLIAGDKTLQSDAGKVKNILLTTKLEELTKSQVEKIKKHMSILKKIELQFKTIDSYYAACLSVDDDKQKIRKIHQCYALLTQDLFKKEQLYRNVDTMLYVAGFIKDLFFYPCLPGSGHNEMKKKDEKKLYRTNRIVTFCKYMSNHLTITFAVYPKLALDLALDLDSKKTEELITAFVKLAIVLGQWNHAIQASEYTIEEIIKEVIGQCSTNKTTYLGNIKSNIKLSRGAFAHDASSSDNDDYTIHCS